MDVLVVVDMQNDFINGSLGTKEAENIVSKVKNTIETFEGKVIFTRDTHEDNYLSTQEGKNLPVPHCIKGSYGWEICDDLRTNGAKIIDKHSFGSKELATYLKELSEKEPIETIKLIGLCTDICVISNALILKAYLPEVRIIVDGNYCAGVTVDSHNNALNAMEVCQIEVVR
ncbi:MAG: cysteine hydrolase [Tissierellia bacterium]|nr:cysteine hydrolase [Tissierellia bacterium]